MVRWVVIVFFLRRETLSEIWECERNLGRGGGFDVMITRDDLGRTCVHFMD